MLFFFIYAFSSGVFINNNTIIAFRYLVLCISIALINCLISCNSLLLKLISGDLMFFSKYLIFFILRIRIILFSCVNNYAKVN